MPEQLFILANTVIMAAYAAITVAIVVPVARAGQLRTNKLATATAMIFFSCSVGHGLHALMALRAAVTADDAGHTGMAMVTPSMLSGVWDLFTAGVGVYYWTLRRAYGVLLSRGAIYVDPTGKQVLDEAGARERAARAAAEAHRATLATVVQHSDDAIIGLTPEGVITAWNRGAENMFGYPADEVMGRPAEILADDSGGRLQRDTLARVRRGERSISYEATRLRKDGSPIDASFSITAITDPAGAVIGISVTARDVTAAGRPPSAARPSPSAPTRPSAWRASANSPAAWPTTSTICSPSSPTTPTSPSTRPATIPTCRQTCCRSARPPIGPRI
ncbi:hypothetical protein GCM10020218_087770 [Dactylosporangium vinaceum]